MKNLYTLIFTLCGFGLFAQAFEVQLVLDENANSLSVVMKNVSATANLPAAGQTISTLSFEMTGGANITGVASTDYTLQAPDGNDIVAMSSTSLPSPENWPMGQEITVAVFDVTAGSTIADFVVTEDVDGDNSDPNDPIMSVLSAAGFNQSISVLATVLPIKLHSFSATKDRDNVKLDWITESEVNGSHFDVQRSSDLESWTTIGTVEAVGESSSKQAYELLDDRVPLNTRGSDKTFYYRLNMVDNDESQEYSEVRVVRFDQQEASFIVYPNPSNNEIFVNLSSITAETGPATMNVVNMQGALVKNVQLATNDDISVDISTLQAGAYFFLVKQGEETFAQKVIKVD